MFMAIVCPCQSLLPSAHGFSWNLIDVDGFWTIKDVEDMDELRTINAYDNGIFLILDMNFL